MRPATWSILCISAVGLGAVIAACAPADSAAIDACEAFVQARLRSPSSYRRIDAGAFIEVGGAGGWASVEYDAVNAFNAPIRTRQSCRFATPGGRWPSREDMVHQARMAAASGDTLCCATGAAPIQREVDNAVADMEAAANAATARAAAVADNAEIGRETFEDE